MSTPPLSAVSRDPSLSSNTLRSPFKLFTEYYGSTFFLLIACVIALSFFVLRPRIRHVKELNAQTLSQLRVVDSERFYLASIEQSVAATRVIASGTIEVINRALPYETNIPSLVQQFGSAAEELGIQVDSIQFREQQGSDRTERDKNTLSRTEHEIVASRILPVEINLSIRARSYGDVKLFLIRLEDSLRLMDVLGITASSGDKIGVVYQLQLRTYVFSAPSALESGGGKTP